MAVTNKTDFIIYNDELQAAYAERVAQNLEAFTARGNGAIVVNDAAAPGDYKKLSFFRLPSGLVSRRIISGTGFDQSVTPITVSQGEDVRVKLSRKIGPVEITFDALRRAGITPDTLSIYLGEMIADSVLQAQFNDALACAVAAIAKTATLNDVSGATLNTLTRAALYGAMEKFGDRQNDIVAWIGHSKPYGDLFDEANTPAAGASDILTQVAIFGAQAPTFNRPFLMTDSAALILDETIDKYFTLGLVRDAIRIELDTQLADIAFERVTGKENLTWRIQGERDWTVGIRGYAWDIASGGANPTDAALATGSNWDLVASSIKDTAGVVVKSR